MVLITEIHQWQLPVEQHNSKGNQKIPKPISRNLERINKNWCLPNLIKIRVNSSLNS
jgi:hypothetical protein